MQKILFLHFLFFIFIFYYLLLFFELGWTQLPSPVTSPSQWPGWATWSTHELSHACMSRWRKWIKMKSGEREAYLPGSGNTEGSSNNGSGHGGFPLLRFFFPSACILLPFMLTVFSRCPASSTSFLHPRG